MRLDMFEVAIINRSPNRWEWLAYNGIPIVEGWERTRAAAKYQGERARGFGLEDDRMTRPERRIYAQ